MFDVGDQVVYPMHGAGTIVALEEREVLGETQKYYVMQMSYGGMKVMIPLRSVDNVGIRQIIDPPQVDAVVSVLKQDKSTMSSNWNKRFKANMEKMKSGSIYEVAEVVRNLALQNKEKKLSTVEKRLYDSARQILLSELVLASEKPLEQVDHLLNDLFI